jgi:protein-disulfide isomerase
MAKKDKSSAETKKESKKDEVIEIPVGKLFSKMKENPWIISTLVLGIVLVVALATGVGGFGGFGSANVASERTVTQNVLGFLNSQVDGTVTLSSISNKGTYYEVVVLYQGEQIPLQATLDGNYIFTDLIPLTNAPAPGVPPPGNNVGTGGRVANIETGDSPVLGNPNAPVTIVEFTDYFCPFCQRHALETKPLIKQNYIDIGKVKYVMMNFLRVSPDAANAALCAREIGGDDVFWRYNDALFNAGPQALSRAKYIEIAGQTGIGGAAFESCVDSAKYNSLIQQQTSYAQGLGVTGTPGFFINGIPVSGAQPYSVFEQIIEQELSS